MRKSKNLPGSLKPLFWDCNFSNVSWNRHRDFVIARVLQSGTWDQIKWIRSRIDDRMLKQWFLRRRGRGFSGRQLRFWELILRLPRRTVNRWMNEPAQRLWDGRVNA